MQEHEHVDNFPKTGPMEFIFGPELENDGKIFLCKVGRYLTSS